VQQYTVELCGERLYYVVLGEGWHLQGFPAARSEAAELKSGGCDL
jgi:hypothetical protein